MEKKLAYNKKILKGVMENGGPVGRDLDNENIWQMMGRIKNPWKTMD